MGGLSVAMLHPCYWPEVRRGSERTIHEVAAGLVARGHRPTLITSHRGAPSRAMEDGFEVIRVPRPPDGRIARRWYEDHLTHAPLSYVALRAHEYDLAHAWYSVDAVVAGRWARATGRPSIFSFMGVPDHKGLMWKRKRLEIMLRAMEESAVTVALSHHAARSFERWLGRQTPVIHPPVDVETFTPGGERAPEPTIVCAASAAEPRKRVPLLVDAFRIVRRERPTARLLLDRPGDPALAAQLHDPAAGVECVDMSERATLVELYRTAWVSALTSFGEGFGLVLAEALACGTPVVGTGDAGIPEVLGGDPAVGRLFDDAEPEAVARALLEALELAGDPATAEACRAQALEFSSDRCTEAYEALYRERLEAG